MSDIAIRVDHLGKQYRIGAQQAPYSTLREALVKAARGPIGWLKGERKQTKRTIWALDDVSFEVKRGEAVGIIGRNGAGKSTLLKVLSRVTRPTRGRVEIYGRVGSLLEVGTGFHPELTGRENIYLNGAILGMRRQEIMRKFDEIVAFAEVEKFLDTPVKFYSSGMYVRLAFAVAAHLKPEILVVDEVLAVGDAAFQKKCLGKMGDVASEGRTVLFVSHNMTAVQNLCERAMLLDNGYLIKNGKTNDVIATYLQSAINERLEQRWDDLQTAPGNKNVRVAYAGISTVHGRDNHYFTVETPIDLIFRIVNFRPDKLLWFNVLLYNQENICVFNTGSKAEAFSKGAVQGICHIPAHLLNDNTYTVRLLIHFQGAEGVDVNSILTFEVHDAGREEWGWYGKWVGVIRPQLEWSLEYMDNVS